MEKIVVQVYFGHGTPEVRTRLDQLGISIVDAFTSWGHPYVGSYLSIDDYFVCQIPECITLTELKGNMRLLEFNGDKNQRTKDIDLLQYNDSFLDCARLDSHMDRLSTVARRREIIPSHHIPKEVKIRF
jgi:hypothetical protein